MNEDLYTQADELGISHAQVDIWLQAAQASAHEKVAALEKIFAVIACVDTQELVEVFLREAAENLLLRLEDVVADYNRWVQRGGRPAC